MSKAHIIRILALILIVAGMSAALISGSTVSAQCTPAPTSGDDHIVCEGTVQGLINGGGGNDTIINNGISSSLAVHGGAGVDTLINNGTVFSLRGGEHYNFDSSSNLIINHGTAEFLTGTGVYGGTTDALNLSSNIVINFGEASTVYGNSAGSDDHDATSRGSSVIINYGTVRSNIEGDYVSARSNHYATADGDDTIINYGIVEYRIVGDTATGITGVASGDDTIINHGVVFHEILGDLGGIASGNDTIINYGVAEDDIIGDRAVANYPIAVGNDTIINHGTVHGDIWGDQGVPPVSSAPQFTNGNDTIINYGTVHGNIIGAGGNDRVVIVNGAPVYGVIDGGPGTDKLTFEFASADYRVLQDLEALANAIMAKNPQGGTVTIDGVTFTWTDFESLLGHLRLLAAYITWPIQVFYPDGDTITIWAPASTTEGFKVAEFHRSELIPGTSGQRFDLPEGRGWYVIVFWVVDHFQVNVYDHQDILVTDRYLIY